MDNTVLVRSTVSCTAYHNLVLMSLYYRLGGFHSQPAEDDMVVQVCTTLFTVVRCAPYRGSFSPPSINVQVCTY